MARSVYVRSPNKTKTLEGDSTNQSAARKPASTSNATSNADADDEDEDEDAGFGFDADNSDDN